MWTTNKLLVTVTILFGYSTNDEKMGYFQQLIDNFKTSFFYLMFKLVSWYKVEKKLSMSYREQVNY